MSGSWSWCDGYVQIVGEWVIHAAEVYNQDSTTLPQALRSDFEKCGLRLAEKGKKTKRVASKIHKRNESNKDTTAERTATGVGIEACKRS